MVFGNLKLKTKLLICFIIIALLVDAVGLAVSVISIRPLLQKLKQESFPSVLLLEDVKHASLDMAMALHEYILSGEENYKAEFKRTAETAQGYIKAYKKAEADEEPESVQTLGKNLEILTNLGEELIGQRERGAAMEDLLPEEKRFREFNISFQSVLDEEVVKDSDDLTRAFLKIETIVIRRTGVILLAAILNFILAVVFGYFISLSISRRLQEIRNAAAEFARGNTDIKIKATSRDEIGELAGDFNRMMEDIKESQEVLKEAKTALEIKVKARTRELEDSAKGLEKRVQERTQKLQEKIEELERFQKLTVAREVKMIELKKEVKKLKKSGKNTKVENKQS